MTEQRSATSLLSDALRCPQAHSVPILAAIEAAQVGIGEAGPEARETRIELPPLPTGLIVGAVGSSDPRMSFPSGETAHLDHRVAAGDVPWAS